MASAKKLAKRRREEFAKRKAQRETEQKLRKRGEPVKTGNGNIQRKLKPKDKAKKAKMKKSR